MKRYLYVLFTLFLMTLSTNLWANLDLNRKSFSEKIADFFKNTYPRGMLGNFEGFPVDMELPVNPSKMAQHNVDLFIGNVRDSTNGLYGFLSLAGNPLTPFGLTASDTTSSLAYWGWPRIPLYP